MTRGPRLDERPRWELTQPASYANDCVDAKAFVRKSGRQGFGMAIQLVSKHDCRVRITPRWRLVDAPRDLALAPIELDMRGRSLRYAWLPVAFDNLAAWNAGRDSGQLTLGFDLVDAPTQTTPARPPTASPPWTMTLRDVMHPKDDEGGP